MPFGKALTVSRVSLAVALAALAGGCASTTSGSTLGGFAAVEPGASRASQSFTAAMGSGLIGGAVGDRLDPADRRKALEAEYRALEYSPAGQPVAWQGRDGSTAGQVVANQPYRVGSQDCRQYSHTVVVAGQTRNLQGSACRNEDGSWTPLV